MVGSPRIVYRKTNNECMMNEDDEECEVLQTPLLSVLRENTKHMLG